MQILVRIIIAICSVFRYTAPKVRERSGRGESPLRITLTDAQANELRFRLRQATRPVPASFWEARDGAPATREGE